MPRAEPTSGPAGHYDHLPSFPLADGAVRSGYDALAAELGEAIAQGHRRIAVDGYGGVGWDDVRRRLRAALTERGIQVRWLDVGSCLLPESALEALLAPYLGGDDPLFGKRYPGALREFFRADCLTAIWDEAADEPAILTGPGAALADPVDLMVYLEVPKDEIQRRMRAGLGVNLGASDPLPSGDAYKRCYFVDWPVLNRHKQALVERVDLVVDVRDAESPTVITGDDLRRGLSTMATSCFRARPWFAPGPWGGQWLMERFGLPADAPNYAWSFELITPENGLVFESDGRRLEIAFDWLMFHDHRGVLGRAADRFGRDFPIRIDYLDTVGGGNLSIQCHPRPDYMREHFGEPFTQDETYYIVDHEVGAKAYLGFQADIDGAAFRRAVERSAAAGVEVDVDRFVASVPTRKHDLLLIPHGTIHGSGAGNLVLEISATPYIFTFKIYDWLRQDLEGKMRPLNIGRAWDNLDFGMKGGAVHEHLIARPRVLAEGGDWRLLHLPTHPTHFYDVHRFEFAASVGAATDERCHVLNLVEGRSVIVETANGHRRCVNFGETVVVPAAAGSYRLVNEGTAPCRVIKAFVK